MKRKPNQISLPASIILNIVFIIGSIICLYPVLLTLGVSFTSDKEIVEYGYQLIPKHATIEAYRVIAQSNSGIFRAYGVTIAQTVVGAFLSVIIIAMFAYPLSRKNFIFRNQLNLFAFITMIFGGGLIPWYMVCTKVLHIDNTFMGLVMPKLVGAWNIMVMRTFIQTTIPDAIIESASIDGAGEWRIFFSFILPLSKAGIATIGLFATLAYWNDWYNCMMLIRDSRLFNLQYYLQKMFLDIAMLKSGAAGSNVNTADLPTESVRMAMCVVAMGPIVIVYPFFQKYFISGLTIGSVKG